MTLWGSRRAGGRLWAAALSFAVAALSAGGVRAAPVAVSGSLSATATAVSARVTVLEELHEV